MNLNSKLRFIGQFLSDKCDRQSVKVKLALIYIYIYTHKIKVLIKFFWVNTILLFTSNSCFLHLLLHILFTFNNLSVRHIVISCKSLCFSVLELRPHSYQTFFPALLFASSLPRNRIRSKQESSGNAQTLGELRRRASSFFSSRQAHGSPACS